MRAYKAILHFNRQNAKNGLPWTIHYRGVCYPAAEIKCLIPIQSEWKPTKKTNPRAFFTAQVKELKWDGKIATLR